MGLKQIIDKLLRRTPPPAQFLTPDGKPKESATSGKPVPAEPEKPKRTGKPVVLYIVTKSNFGGAQRYVYDLATRVPKEYEAVVMCGGAHGNVEESLLVSKLTDAGVATVVIPALTRDIGFADFSAAYKLYKVIKAEAPAILHLNSSKAGGLGALAGRFAKVPMIIFTAHGWPFGEQRNIFSRVLIWFASVATILLSHKVICVSAYDRNQFRGWFFTNKLVVVHNAVPPFDFETREDAKQNLVPHSDLYKDDVWVGTLGELTPNKNIWLAFEAVKKARDMGANIFYGVVGDGEERLEMEDKIKEMQMTDNIKLLGFITEARRLLKAFDIMLLTSRKEGLPYTVLEAQRAGLPIVASNVGGVSEIIHDGENGILCQSDNVDQFAEALAKLAKDEQLRLQFGSKIPPDQFDNMLRETFLLYH